MQIIYTSITINDCKELKAALQLYYQKEDHITYQKHIVIINIFSTIFFENFLSQPGLNIPCELEQNSDINCNHPHPNYTLVCQPVISPIKSLTFAKDAIKLFWRCRPSPPGIRLQILPTMIGRISSPLNSNLTPSTSRAFYCLILNIRNHYYKAAITRCRTTASPNTPTIQFTIQRFITSPQTYSIMKEQQFS